MLAGSDRSPEFGQGAAIGGILGQDGGNVAQPWIGRRGQVVLPGGRGREAALTLDLWMNLGGSVWVTPDGTPPCGAPNTCPP